MDDLERSYLAMKENIEYENSVFSNWELEVHRQQQLIKDIEVRCTFLEKKSVEVLKFILCDSLVDTSHSH